MSQQAEQQQQLEEQQQKEKRWQRVKTAFANWLETGRLSVGWQIAIGIFLFLAGAVGQHFLQVGLGKLSRSVYANVWILILLLTVAVVALTITAAVLLSGLKVIIDRFKKDHKDATDTAKTNQETILNAVSDHHAVILQEFESLASRFMLEAEFIAGAERAYERTKQLVEKANKSLVFLDWWVTGTTNTSADRARVEYYQAITKRLEEYINDHSDGSHNGDLFHERIIQIPEGEDPTCLAKDTVFADYLRKCGELQRGNESITSVSKATPLIQTHLVIIDDTHIVQTLLTSNEEEGSLQRYGVIVYHDNQRKELVNRYKTIIKRLKKRERLDDLDKILTEPPSPSPDETPESDERTFSSSGQR